MYIPINWHVYTIMYHTDVGKRKIPPMQLYHGNSQKKTYIFYLAYLYDENTIFLLKMIDFNILK
jgi:hypothetical protein